MVNILDELIVLGVDFANDVAEEHEKGTEGIEKECPDDRSRRILGPD